MPNQRAPVVKTVASNMVLCVFFICCPCRTWINMDYVMSVPGLIKVAEVIMNSVIQGLLVEFGLPYYAEVGSAFEVALSVSSACFLNSSVLLLCYLISEKSYKTIRSTKIEVIFNGIACCCYLSSAVYLGFATTVYLWPRSLIIPGFYVYPGMKAAYYLCGVTGILYGLDTYIAYVESKR